LTSIDKASVAFISVFLTGALWPSLPHVSLIIVASVAIVVLYLYSLSAVALGALLGFTWVMLTGHWYLNWQIDKTVFGQNVIVEGKVTSISLPLDVKESIHNNNAVNKIPKQLRFNMRLDKIGKHITYRSPEVRLNWYNPELLPEQGQRFRLLLRLKAPSGLANPYTFHYQTWLASKNIVATGAVLNSPSNILINEHRSLRQQSINMLSTLDVKNERWLQALTFGYRGELSDEDWSLLQISGTAHLFAISGLHLGIVCGYCLFILRRPLALSSALLSTRQGNIGKVSLLFALLLCVFYAYLAGFQVPVVRSLLGLILWTYLSLSSSHWRLPSVCMWLLVTFFIVFPYAILSVSFWFSFIAVLSVWLFSWRFAAPKTLTFWSGFRYTCYLQVWLTLITAPITLYIFEQLPLFALFANLILVPWVSFILVPICLLASTAMLLSLPYKTLFELASKAMDVALLVMQQAESLNKIFVQWLVELGFDWQSISNISNLSASHMLMILIVIILWLLPFWPQRRMLMTLVGVGFFMSIGFERSTQSKLTVFDVGQGTAALLEHQNIAWLFDTGGAYPSGFSMAESVLLPYFRQNQLSRIDKLFLSHLDNDHAGGLAVLEQNLNVTRVLSPESECVAPNQFSAKDIHAMVLWPMTVKSGQENNHSCVLMLNIKGHRILFTGDIEREAEAKILRRSINLKTDILIAPHHGSKSSSTHAFVDSVSPEYVVFTAGVSNRWSFPDIQVAQRYEDIGSKALQTGKQGAITFSFDKQDISVTTYREDMYNRWYYKSPD
jgi:competence protein ComEC